MFGIKHTQMLFKLRTIIVYKIEKKNNSKYFLSWRGWNCENGNLDATICFFSSLLWLFFFLSTHTLATFLCVTNIKNNSSFNSNRWKQEKKSDWHQTNCKLLFNFIRPYWVGVWGSKSNYNFTNTHWVLIITNKCEMLVWLFVKFFN